ncbi:MAG: ankyrin repeat protein [Terrestrivirus sp.]|uniref:Ankyrin repeat protein n=1 Tax=Terrestrivirus sp. TaxID=2487775 RepID=A0A3G4ZP78_9VIRU|nr:MAG: ankyrin repeat protein [Terrestrivirus sp.]
MYSNEVPLDSTNNMVEMSNLQDNQILFTLLKNHQWEQLHEMIGDGSLYDLNVRDEYNNYLLTYAILYNRIDIVTLLIDGGARIDITDSEERSILYIAIKYDYLEIIDVLLKYNSNHIGISIIDIRDKNYNVPLHYAIIYNNYTALEKLLEYGTNPNVIDRKGYNALHLAVYTRTYKICNIIITHNVEINARCNSGETALHMACNLQLIDIVKLLLDNNINVNIQDHDHEFTALHYCVNLNNRDLVSLLLSHNADPNIQDMVGNTAIHYCVSENNLECLIMIMSNKNNEFKINLNLWNFDGHIPLHLVLISELPNFDEYFNILIDDSNVNIQDSDGETCLHILCYKNLWQNYIDTLKKKKLDIFVANKINERPVDYIKKSELELFMNMVSDSYLYRLRNKDIVWANEWENMCKKELPFDNSSKDLLNKLDVKKQFNKNFDENPDVCHTIIKSKLFDMYNEKNVKYCSKSFPVKQGNICISISEGTNLNVCTFTGSTLDILIGLIYLLKKYPDACSTFSRNFSENKELCKFYKSIGIIMNTHCEFLNFEIVWVYHKLYLMDDFYDNFRKCVKRKNNRYVIIPLGIEMREGSHANYIIYDKTTNEVERFEPHGSSAPTGLNYNPSLLDDILEIRFKELNKDIKYIRPKDYLPKIGFQLLDVSERRKKKIGDPGGFCALWAVWYVDMRLTYRTVNRNDLIKQMISSIKSQNVSFKNLIRNYAKNIIDIRDVILSAAGLDINDWLNDQFTESQIDIILKELGREVGILVT